MSASPAPSSSRKRSRTSLALDSEDDYEDQDAAPISQPASRKRKAASASSAVAAGPTANKKTDRMERNRLAAQASRDRRKAYTEELEAKVALLESQIASGSTLPRAASAAPSPASGRLATLEEENESLRQQLELSRSENVQVQLRMKDFESKLEWLSQLMSNQSQQQSSVSSTSVSPHDLQQHPSLSPISSTLSLDPQAVLSLLPVSPKQSTSSALSASPALIQQEQSLDGQQVESLVAANFDLFPSPDSFSTGSLFPEADSATTTEKLQLPSEDEMAALARQFTFQQSDDSMSNTSAWDFSSQSQQEYDASFWEQDGRNLAQEELFGAAFPF